MKPSIAIIGYGRFGRLAGTHLKRYFRVFAADAKTNVRCDPGIRRISVKEAAQTKIVVIAVPIRVMPTVLRKITPFLKKGTLVCDVGSVKEKPVQWMKAILPKDVSILGTHPLFGPESARAGLSGMTIVLCPVRIPRARYNSISHAMTRGGLIVRKLTPIQHDKLMASTLFLTQFTGRLLDRLHLASSEGTTRNFALLSQIVASSRKDSYELFQDMYTFNRFARRVPPRVLEAHRHIMRALASR
jgi:prephenate dehydrogenase